MVPFMHLSVARVQAIQKVQNCSHLVCTIYAGDSYIRGYPETENLGRKTWFANKQNLFF